MGTTTVFTAAQLSAFLSFALVTSITPGPNNVMLLVSGLNIGFRRTLPHVIGISAGFGVMIAVVGAGLGPVFLAYPLIYHILQWVCAAYLLYLAWKIGTSGPPAVNGAGDSEFRPFGFWRAAGFQWINPKAWVMAIAAIVTYAPFSSSPVGAVLVVALVAIVFAVVNLPSVAMWAYFGSVLQRFLHHPRLVRGINVTMALLLIASLYPLVTE